MKITLMSFFAVIMAPVMAMAMSGVDKEMLATQGKEDLASVVTPEIIAAIKAQNKKHESLTQEEILALDTQWREEAKAGSGALIDAVMGNDASSHLTGVKIVSGGRITELFVMDNKGLNVAQSDITSDYWQGDEAKFSKTFEMGPDAVFVDDVEMDDSTQSLQTQVSFSIADPETGEAIGAVTFGVKLN